MPGYFIGTFFNIAEIWLTRSGIFLIALVISVFCVYLLAVSVSRRIRPVFSFLNSVWKSIADAISVNPDVKRLKKRHETTFKFIGKRLSRNHFYGLQLTVLVVAFLYILLLFGGVTEDVINSDFIVATDIRVANLLTVFRDIELSKFFLLITLLGQSQVVAASLLGVIGLLLL